MKNMFTFFIIIALAAITGFVVSCTDDDITVTPTVTSVTIAPSDDVMVYRGGTLQFNVTVQGSYQPPQTVTWSVEDNESDGTTISLSGLLEVDEDETAEELTVKAVSTLDSSYSDTVTVTLFNPTIAIGDTFFNGTLFEAITSVAGKTATITIYDDITSGPIAITAENTHITLLGDSAVRTIQLSDTATTPLFTLWYNPGAGNYEAIALANDALPPNADSPRQISLTLGANITLKGIEAGINAPLVRVRERAKLVMLDGSKITGHRNNDPDFRAAVHVASTIGTDNPAQQSGFLRGDTPSSVIPFFLMKGGEITGNVSGLGTGVASYFDTAGGLIAGEYTLIMLEGGSISGNTLTNTSNNFNRDIWMANTQAGTYFGTGTTTAAKFSSHTAGFFLSGDAVIGRITGRSTNTEYCMIAFNGEWTGTATIDLSRNNAGNTAGIIEFWNNKQVFRKAHSGVSDTVLQSGIGKFTLGSFIGVASGTALAPVLISDTHVISVSGGNIGTLVEKP